MFEQHIALRQSAFIGIIILLAISTVLSITSGPISLPIKQSLLTVWDTLAHSNHNTLSDFERVIITELRWPRTLLALFIGALLSLCGAVMQGLFRNPLADPGIIGVSSGAGLGAAISIVLLPVGLSYIMTPISAFLGGLITTLLVYRLAQSSTGSTSILILLLAGVALASFTGAVVGFLTFIANDESLRTLTLWGMGSLNNTSETLLWLSGLACVSLWLFFQSKAKALNALLLGEAEAEHLGIDTEKLKLQLIIAIAIGIGIAVSASGIIGFIGLVIPHLIRITLGPDHRYLLPLSALTGAALLLLADTGARTWMSPAEMPVGLVTALIGAPFFIFLLLQQRQRLNTL